MYNYILKDVKNDQQIQINNLPGTSLDYKNAPVNWNKMQYTFTRNEKYSGLFPTFTASLGFVKKVKTWLNNIFWTQRLSAEIQIVISAFNIRTRNLETFIHGVGNMENFISKQFQSNLEVIDPLFIQDVLNKDGVDLDYQKMIDTYAVDHSQDVTWNKPSFATLRINGLITTGCPAGYVDGFAVYPFQLFQQMVGLMTGNQNAFFSSFFGKTTDKDQNGVNYSEDGPGAYMMITTGRFIRGFTYGDIKSGTGQITTSNLSASIVGTGTQFLTELIVTDQIKDTNGVILGTVQSIEDNTHLTLITSASYTYTGFFNYQNPSDSATLILSFEKLFKAYNAIFNLGMSVVTNNSGTFYVSIEKKRDFYKDDVMAIIHTPKNLEISFDPNWRYNNIEVGYSKFQKNKDNPYGTSEYNNKTTYVAPTKFVKKPLQIVSEIRGDGTGIQLCLDNVKSGPGDTAQNEYDNEIFIISSEIKDAILQSRNADNMSVVTGSVYGTNPMLNPDISPARMVKNWGEMIRVNLDVSTDLVLTFHKAEELTRLSTQLLTESTPVSDGVDIPISSLAVPFLSGFEANFSSPFGIDEILDMKRNPFGLVKFWDYINKVWRYGWVKEVGTEPIDKKTNWKVAIASTYITPVERTWKLKYLSGDYIEYLSGDKILLLNQN